MKPIKSLPTSYGDYFATTFSRRFPNIASLVRPEQTGFAANVYLFRFDKHLTSDFINGNIDAISRSIADISGKSVPEARRIFTTGARDAAREYFAGSWQDVSRYVRANTPSLVHIQMQSTKHTALIDSLQSENGAPEVDPVLLHSLLEHPLPVIVLFFANYCSVCKAVLPSFEQASRAADGAAVFVTLNGPKWPELKDQYAVTAYPTILRYENATNVSVFPSSHPVTLDAVVAFAKGQQLGEDSATAENAPESPNAVDEAASPRTRVYNWQSLLKRQGIDELDALASERDEVLHSKIDKAIQCGDSSCELLPPRSNDPSKGDTPPMCVLLGGGMGAGKTTVVGLVAATSFWKEYGDGIVVVEADAFKLSDPLFQVLQSVTPLASRIVHRDSIVAAEELFLKAVNSRRDVVFDGTLSWCEYARQTVAMLRDTGYYYERGPGYIEDKDGTVTETYWVRAEKRQRPVDPYRVELVGVTAEAAVSVMRGIVRRITTGRGVAVHDQLKSHSLFSQHFEDYVDMMDSVYLFDTTQPKEGEERTDYSGHLIAVKPGVLFELPMVDGVDDIHSKERAIDGFVVRNPEAYERFLQKKWLNIRANSVSELYAEQAVGRYAKDIG